MATEEPASVQERSRAYDRGHAAGEIAARLSGHDQHFDSINGNLATLAADIREMRMLVQRLADQREADARTLRSTAEAVEKATAETAAAVERARVARHDISERRWSPFARTFAVIAAVGTLAAVFALILRVT